MGQQLTTCVEDMTSTSVDIEQQCDRTKNECAAGWMLLPSPRNETALHNLTTAAGLTNDPDLSNPKKGRRRYWFVAKGWPECTLAYYQEHSGGSQAAKGIIHLLKADVKVKSEDGESGHFQIHHSVHGTKHLYCDDAKEMHQWVRVLTKVVKEATENGGMEGYLKKRGGFRLMTWQSRWFMLMGSELLWYENATDSFPLGKIFLSAMVHANEVKPDPKNSGGGEHRVFEIVDENRHDAKRRREFAVETITDLHCWVNAVNKSVDTQRVRSKSRARGTSGDSVEGEQKNSFSQSLRAVAAGADKMGLSSVTAALGLKSDDDDEDNFIKEPEKMTGWMEKNSSWGIWQNKYFECCDGHLKYYKTDSDKEKGDPTVIHLTDLLKGSPSVTPGDHTGLLLATEHKIYSFRCKSAEDATKWSLAIRQWKAFYTNEEIPKE